MRTGPRRHSLGPDDWLVDIWFKGLKTGKVIHKRVGVPPTVDEGTALHLAMRRWKVFDMERLVDARVQTRRERDAKRDIHDLGAA